MGDAEKQDGDQASESPALLEELCRVVHLCWSEKMRRDGWHASDSFDAQKRAHDALMPFERLSRRDRRSLRIAVIAEELELNLADVVEYERGPDRVFVVEEMSVGLRIGLAPTDEPSHRDDVLGVVVDWAVGPATRELESIQVRWDDGDVTHHHPDVRELRRLE